MADEQPFAQLMGFEVVRDGVDPPYIAITVSERHRQANGVVHGGVVVAMMDTIMGLQCFRAAGRKPVATSEISVHFLLPIFDGRIEARARVIKTGKRTIVVESTVTRDGAVMAIATSTFMPVGPASV